jgi:hypothetical protein
MFDFSISGLFAGLIFGCIGIWMFREGKRYTDLRIVMIGIALMVYPYFTHGPLMDWGVGAGLCGVAYYIW